ncbi:MAG: D-aminoacylase [Verrucomicrobia bacterium]|nr:D-aminoacylase [Verrucomicrobiota bacterium]
MLLLSFAHLAHIPSYCPPVPSKRNRHAAGPRKQKRAMSIVTILRFARFCIFASAVACLLLPRAMTGAEAPATLILRHALIVDGSGAPAFRGDVAIRGDRIIAVGEVPFSAPTEVDLGGRILAPGFIDVHTHVEDLAEVPQAENFLRMGVTTLVTGNCGGSALDVAAFLTELEVAQPAVNLATLIGHNTVRAQVMGGSFARPPTAAELEQMRALVAAAMRDGAVGLSTGLIYLPGTFARTDEIVALAKVAAASGGLYASHMRYENARILEAIEEALQVGREAGTAVQISHIKLSSPAAWGLAPAVIARLDRARAEGVQVAHDQYLYTASSTSLGTTIPDSARAGGRERLRERLDIPEERERIRAGMRATLERGQRTDFTYAVIANFAPDPTLNGLNVPEAARRLHGSDSLDAQLDTILGIELQGGASAVFHGMSEPNLREFLALPLTMIASDSGTRRFGVGVPHPRGYGNNVRFLAHYVRDERLLGVEEAVRRMTDLPAQQFPLGRRGLIRPGFIADAVVFDLKRLSSASTFRDPHHYAEGMDHVIVAGQFAIRDGALTGVRPGRIVRREPRALPAP